MPQAQDQAEEPGLEALEGQHDGLGPRAVQAQRQGQQGAQGQPQQQGASVGPGPAGRWGPEGTR